MEGSTAPKLFGSCTGDRAQNFTVEFKNISGNKKSIHLLNFTSAISSESRGFMLVLLSVFIRSVELNIDSIEVDVGKRQKIAFAKLHRIGKDFLRLNYKLFK